VAPDVVLIGQSLKVVCIKVVQSFIVPDFVRYRALVAAIKCFSGLLWFELAGGCYDANVCQYDIADSS
jgi:hypothetical protein